MNAPLKDVSLFCADYAERLQAVLQKADWRAVARLAEELLDCWRTGRQVFICGNGGSAGNAVHLANDFFVRHFQDIWVGVAGNRFAG